MDSEHRGQWRNGEWHEAVGHETHELDPTAKFPSAIARMDAAFYHSQSSINSSSRLSPTLAGPISCHKRYHLLKIQGEDISATTVSTPTDQTIRHHLYVVSALKLLLGIIHAPTSDCIDECKCHVEYGILQKCLKQLMVENKAMSATVISYTAPEYEVFWRCELFEWDAAGLFGGKGGVNTLLCISCCYAQLSIHKLVSSLLACSSKTTFYTPATPHCI